MKYTSSYHLGPEKTPQAIKILILLTGGIGIISSLISGFIPMGYFTTQHILGLSLWGIEHGFLWQFFTYLFVFPTSNGISFGYLIHLVFNLYLLWIIGTALIERSSTLRFCLLYFLSGIISGIVAAIFMALFNYGRIFAGNTTSIYAILFAWMILNPRATLLLFFTIPMRAMWLILGLFGANLIIDLSRGDFVTFFSYLSTMIFSYFFTLIAWRFHSPFPFLNTFEAKILNSVEGIRRRRKTPKAKASKTKIYDFKTGEPVQDKDEKFVDEMLAKISKYGEESLSPKEREKLQKISKNKKT